MPRQARLNLPGLFYHVMVRGIERRKIFRQKHDYEDFLTRLMDCLAKTGCRCFSFALMPNHLHLLLLSGVRGIVSLMHPLLTGYATGFNLRYRRVGHLFQNRYKAIICEEDPYFRQLIGYIPLNPVRAKMIRTPQELALYPWTSHSAMLGTIARPWMESEEVLRGFGSTVSKAKHAYERYIVENWDQGHQDVLEGGGLLRSMESLGGPYSSRRSSDRQAFDPRILGSGHFVEQILREADALDQTKKEVRKNGSFEELQQAIAGFCGVDPAALLSRDFRRDVSQARAMLIFSATDWLGQSGTAISDMMELSTSSISAARARGRQLAKERNLFEFLKTEKTRNVP